MTKCNTEQGVSPFVTYVWLNVYLRHLLPLLYKSIDKVG